MVSVKNSLVALIYLGLKQKFCNEISYNRIINRVVHILKYSDIY